MSSEVPTSPGELVTRFVQLIERGDLDAALLSLADDCVYDNVPFGPVVGPEAVRATLAPFLAPFDIVEWRVERQLESGSVRAGTVLHERLDRFGLPAPDGSVEWLELPVAGIFTVTDGRITLWRDYFDRAPLLDWMSRHG